MRTSAATASPARAAPAKTVVRLGTAVWVEAGMPEVTHAGRLDFAG